MMIFDRTMGRWPWLAAPLALALGACATHNAAPPARIAQTPPPAEAAPPSPEPDAGGPNARATILPGEPGAPVPPEQPAIRPAPNGRGDVTLNFPQVDVQTVSKAVLGDILGLRYSVDPSVHGVMTLQTAEPTSKKQLLPLFEEALRTANLALVSREGVYTIVPLASARGEAGALGPADFGFGEETIQLKFANAAELKKLLDPVVPGAISQADPDRGIIVVTGTTTQRYNVRQLIEQFDVDWLKGMSFALFVPQRTDARLIEPELDKLLNGPGAPTAGMVRLLTMDRINGILAISRQAQYLEDVRRWVDVLDREGESNQRKLYVYHVQNGRASDLAKVLIDAFGGAQSGLGAAGKEAETQAQAGGQTQSILTSGPPPAPNPSGGAGTGQGTQVSADQMNATISADETNNAVIVYATGREYAVIQDALNRLDVPPLQVLLDATITEVTLNANLTYGVEWFLQTHNVSQGYSNGTTALPVQIFPGYSLLFQEGANALATLNALSKVSTIKILSAPEVVVLNNHTASLEVGDQVPIVTTQAISTAGATPPIVNSVDYKDTGVILKVTPRVNDSGLVLLDISQEVSEVQTTDTSNIDSPTIQQRKIATSVAVRDGQTIALGGLITDNRTKGKSVIPILGDIPVLENAFGDHSVVHDRTELLVMLTPKVIRTSVDADAITEELREKIHALAPH